MAKGMRELLAEARARIVEIDTAEAEAVLARDERTLFLDVRESEEFAQGHVPGALLIPRGMLEPKAAADSPARDSQLADPERPIVAYCGSGARSALAAVTLAELGFTHVRSMAGGFQAWAAESRPIDR
ncbi:MAG TPA: rhodanese-like domain-containing protein [Myxococcota bacterium]|nr:rhodanese-like domain-containing protein [Myxococcota bacterium]